MLRMEQVSKVFNTANGPVKALDRAGLEIEEGGFIVIRGPSGSGKTTLLLTLGGMQRPTTGRVLVGNRDLYALTPRERARFRAENIGFVFQMFHLVPYLTVLENVLLAAGGRAARGLALDLLDHLHLSTRLHHKPGSLSAGEKQRTAMARALINQPRIILADEPTGNLDSENAAGIMDRLTEFQRNGGTVVVATHGSAADAHAGSVIRLHQGRIEQA